MFLIKRKISPYTHHDIIIGLFNELKEAKRNRDLYIEKCQQKDEWGEQAYNEVDLEKDVEIEDISKLIRDEENITFNQLFVISLFEEGFGQITRKIEAFYTSIDEAEKYVKEKESQGFEYEPAYYEIENIEINKSNF